MSVKRVLRYAGAKWTIADWIVAQLPAHKIYVEPYFGSGAVFFTKRPAQVEVLNDLDGRVVNLFRVLRDQPDALAEAAERTPYAREEYESIGEASLTGDPLEDARRFLVRCWQGVGPITASPTSWLRELTAAQGVSCPNQWRGVPRRINAAAERLRSAYIECRPARDVIRDYANPDALIYADPPYHSDVRTGNIYLNDISDADHAELLDTLEAHPGPVVLSGYTIPLYEERLASWDRRERSTRGNVGAARTEVLWIKGHVPSLFDGMEAAW